ncbi:MAG TPA: type II toxin-antitoxin system HicA family toxin [Polyangia bacterium]|nr:type II toxin-antitoxin system HicA family toxin [Polyangia bacterium]
MQRFRNQRRQVHGPVIGALRPRLRDYQPPGSGSSATESVWYPTTPVGVKKSDLDRRLREQGWWLDRQGGRHEVWTNGKLTEPVPRHREIHERTAHSILRKAEASPGPRGRR